MQPVKNILFDLGNVLLPLHMHRTYDGFAALGIPAFQSLFDSYSGEPFIEQFETGHISEAQFTGELLQRCRPGVTVEQVIIAWNAMLDSFNPANASLLQQLAKHHRLFLFSNTNSIHYRHFQQDFQRQTGLPSLEVLFEKPYFSHLFGHRKPNPEGFLTILAENGLTASETLFIDDGAIHIATAKQLGFQCYHITEQQRLEGIDWGQLKESG
jgi:glucose-1-phosphatase